MIKIKAINNYNKNLILNYLFKILSIMLAFVSTRLVLGYLGATLYGLWVTITSVVSWLNSGDLGIGNGLRNELANAYALSDKDRELKLIAVTIRAMVKMASVLFIIIIIISEIFFKTGILQNEVRVAMYITSTFFCINLVLGVSQSVALAYQKSWLTSLVIALHQILQIASILLLEMIKVSANLNFYAVINGLCTTLPNIALILMLRKENIHLFERGIQTDGSLIKKVINTGLSFFGIQICSVILYSTDSIIINKVLTSPMVAKYDVISKVYDAGNSIFSIMLIALWSAVTLHIAQNDWKWVKHQIKQLLIVWMIYSMGVVGVSLLFNKLVVLWLGSTEFVFEPSLVFLFGIYGITAAFCAIFANVLNGIGIIKIQLIISVAEAVINIPLSIILATTFHLGLFGVKLATFVCVLFSAIVLSMQVLIIFKKNKTKGTMD